MNSQTGSSNAEIQCVEVVNDKFTFNNELNVAFLERSYSQNLQFGQKMFRIFLSTIDQDLEELSSAVYNSDYSSIKKITHKVKNNFTWVGLPILSSIMHKIEQAAKNSSIEVIALHEKFLLQFQNEYVLVKQEYERMNKYLG